VEGGGVGFISEKHRAHEWKGIEEKGGGEEREFAAIFSSSSTEEGEKLRGCHMTIIS